MKSLKVRIVGVVCLVMMGTSLLSSETVHARRIRNIKVTYDEKETETHYALIGDEWLPIVVRDFNSNVLEKYCYVLIPRGRALLQEAKIRNIETGSW